MDVVLEEQAKLGFRREKIRLYYPLSTLNHLLGTQDTAEQMEVTLAGQPESMTIKLGKLAVSRKGDRFCLCIPEEGSAYVHEHFAEKGFIYELIRLIGQHGYCYIADDAGNIVYHPQQQLIYASLKEENQKNMENGTYIKSNVIYTVNSLQNCDWHIVGVCYVDEMITNKVERVVSSLVVILAIVLAGTVFLGSVFSDLFSKPVTSLVRAMGEFEGNSAEFVYHPVTGTKEISALSDSFEHMAVRIQKLMEEVRQEEISLRKTELKALQAQINPHFLYNTLDAIAWMCEAGRNEDAVEMVNALARLFRISISRGHELIPIEKELQHAQSYLHIQNFRYKNQFRYQFDVDEACLSYYCNKITLQPIIENAIYHGMDRMVDEGMIRISIHQSEDKIIFTVEDNGVGMTEEQCEEVLKKERSDRAGIGIKNVNDRIKIYFGEEYGLTIKSELDEGTCVTIMMPKVTEGSYEDK